MAEDFKSRIQKIEQKRSQEVGQRDAENEQKENGGKRRRMSSTTRVLLMGIVIFAIVIGVTPFLIKKYPEKFTFTKTASSSAKKASPSKSLSERFVSLEDINRKEKPTALREITFHGIIYSSPTVLNITGAELVLNDIVEDFVLTTPKATLAEVTAFGRVKECSFQAPAPGDKVAGVRINDALLETQIQAFTKGQMSGRLLASMRRSLKYGREIENFAFYGGHVNAIDVFVTDTSAPIYLVLQSSGDGKVWHIHLAEGVTLSHVAMIGSSAPALTIPQEGLSFQSMFPKEFVGRIDFFEDEEAPDCMPVPWHKPRSDWIAYQRSLKDNDLYENQMKTFNNGFAAYDRWYKSVFGVDAMFNTVQASGAAHVLVGPVPSKKLKFRNFAGSKVMITSNDYIFSGEADIRAEYTASLYADLLNKAAGGNVDMIEFGEVARTGQ